MQEVAAVRFPSGSSLALAPADLDAPADLHANDARLSHGFSDKGLKSSDFSFPDVSAPSLVPPFPETCDSGDPWRARVGEGFPPPLRSQSSFLRVSQSVSWTKTGVVVERHVASARLVTAGSGAAERGFSSAGAAAAQRSAAAAVSSPPWGSAAAALLPVKGSRPASPIAASPAAAGSRAAALACTSSPPSSQIQALQFVRRLEVVEGGRCSAPSSRSLFFQKEESTVPAGINAFSTPTRQPVAALEGVPFLGGTEGKEALTSTDDSSRADGREPSFVVSGQRPLRRPSGAMRIPEGEQQSKASSVSHVSPKRFSSKGEGGSDRTNGSLARRRSAGPSVDVSFVRTVKGPRLRSEQIEREPAAQRGRKVTVRPRRQGRNAADDAVVGADDRVSLPFFNPTDAKKGIYSSAWKQEQEQSEHRTVSTRKSKTRRSFPSQAEPSVGASSRNVSFVGQPLNRRPMSTTEAYFGRVPGASADFQRLLSFRGSETHLPAAADCAVSMGVRKEGKERVDQPAFLGSTTKLGQERGSIVVRGSPDKLNEVQTTQQPRGSERQLGSKEGKDRGSDGKWRRPPTPPLAQTEAASAVRALAAAQASAEAAAAERAALAGPPPAWRRQQQQVEALEKNKKALSIRQSTLRKSLSLPLTFFAKVKAKFSRSKSTN
ncbi:hypothetical protein ACSSS7_005828 [Eimeria intestinalis]